MPGQVTTKWWKEERGERIFVDFNQNARDRTIASRLLAPAAAARAGVRSAARGTSCRRSSPSDFTCGRCRRGSPSRATCTPAIDDVAHDLTPLLEWSSADERDHGLGDMPYPPDYPKMPGEPPRVQPSRKNAANWDDAD